MNEKSVANILIIEGFVNEYLKDGCHCSFQYQNWDFLGSNIAFFDSISS